MHDSAPAPPPHREHLWMAFTRPPEITPIVFERGEGVWLFDSAGKRYLDGVGALEANAVGHGRRRLAQAAAAQMEQLAFLDVFRYTSRPALDLAAKLAEITPEGLNRVQFTPGGSEAVEVAIKLAWHYHHLRGEPRRRRVICRSGAYHGTTLGAMNCDGHYFSTRNDIYLDAARFGEVAAAPATGPDWGRGGRHAAGAAQFRAKITQLGFENVAAIIVDPLATASGVACAPASDLHALRALCDEFGILLIVDEIITGFGRSGRLFVSDLYGVRPDLMPISKALSSGYMPIGATMISDRIVDAFLNGDPRDAMFAHGHTFGGHPVACAVALENICIIEEEQLAERARTVGRYLGERLATLNAHPAYVDHRGVGLLYGLEIVEDDASAGRFGSRAAAGVWFRQRCRDLGLVIIMLHPGNVALMAPPLVISEAEVDRMVEILDQALTDLEREL